MKTVYVVGLYPGIVINPFYITVDEPTTDYQAILNILADRLTAKGADGMFDDAEEYNDDEIVVAGNECRRLIHGGCLSVREFDLSDMTAIFQEKCGTDDILGWVSIRYSDEESIDDIGFRSYCVNSAEELANKWMDFCNKKDISPYEALISAEIKCFKKHYHTERGIVYVIGTATEDIAYKAGFGYSFHSKELRRDLFSKCLDDRGLRRQFLLIETEQYV